MFLFGRPEAALPSILSLLAMVRLQRVALVRTSKAMGLNEIGS